MLAKLKWVFEPFWTRKILSILTITLPPALFPLYPAALFLFNSSLSGFSHTLSALQCLHGHLIWWTKINMYFPDFALLWHFDYEVKISGWVETKANIIFSLEIICLTSPLLFSSWESKPIRYLFNKKKWNDQVSCNKLFQAQTMLRGSWKFFCLPNVPVILTTGSHRAELIIPFFSDRLIRWELSFLKENHP